ncbi:MAG TPA: outer membrane beta-barrel protein [Vicinamibacterales bacterium]|nr:outer membrane beta-barrel protein [Vicinamibacterales bacterium]
MKAQLLGLTLIMGLVPAMAFAQGRMPHKGAAAIGGEVGVFLPKEDALTRGPALEGFYEYYLSARDSVRLGVGWANPKFEHEKSDSLRQIRVGVDLVHNWEGGQVHPFVGAGVGTYFLQFRDNGHNVGDSETKVGGTIFGGAEFFTSNTVSVKGEARYHIVSKINDFNPSGLALTFGVKSYF